MQGDEELQPGDPLSWVPLRQAMSYRSMRVPEDVVALYYGALAAEVFSCFNCNSSDFNDGMLLLGRNAGTMIADLYLVMVAKAEPSCVSPEIRSFSDLICRLAYVGIKHYLGLDTTVKARSVAAISTAIPSTVLPKTEKVFEIWFHDCSPLERYVELPHACLNTFLSYSSFLVGVLEAAFQVIRIEVDVSIPHDRLKGDRTTVLQVEFIKNRTDER